MRRIRLLTDQVAQALPTHPAIDTVPGPIDQEGFTAHLAQTDVAPEAAIVAAVAIVAHDKHMTFGNHLRAIVVAIHRAAELRIVTLEVGMAVLHGFAVDENLF